MDFNSIKENENFIRFLMDKKPLPLVNPKTDDDKSLLKACQDFEAIFVQQLLKEMRKTVPKDGFIPESNEHEDSVRLFSGQRVIVRFETPAKPLMAQWWRSLLQLLQRRFNI